MSSLIMDYMVLSYWFDFVWILVVSLCWLTWIIDKPANESDLHGIGTIIPIKKTSIDMSYSVVKLVFAQLKLSHTAWSNLAAFVQGSQMGVQTR